MRLVSLDLLRLIAVVLVLVSHLTMIEGYPDYVRPFTQYGSFGVTLFFVLSGFLVSGLIFREHRQHGDFSIWRFYTRRAWKIYPPFYLLLGFTYIYSRYWLRWKIPDRTIFTEIFFLQSYCIGYWNHTWSLAVEEHFYIVLPLLLLGMLRVNRLSVDPFQAIPMLVVSASVVVLLLRLGNFALRDGYTPHTHGFPTHLRIDGLFLGVLIAYFYHYRSIEGLRRWRYPLIILGGVTALVLPVVGPFESHYRCTVGLTQENIGCAAILIGCLLIDFPRSIFSTLGSYSYSIYLWHMALIYWVLNKIELDWEMKATAYLIGAFVIGITLAKVWELPVIRIRDRYFPTRLAA